MDWVDAAPFTAAPQDLLTVAKETKPAEDRGVVVLLDDVRVTVDDAGRETQSVHRVFVLTNRAAVDNWGTIVVPWSGWYQDRPVIRARVIGADGRVSEIDPAHVSEAVDPDADPSVFTDQHMLRAPLPNLAVGAVVEEQWTTTDTQPWFGTGASGGYSFGDAVPVEHTRMRVDVPDAAPLAYHVVGGLSVTPQVTRADGRRTLVVSAEHLDPWADGEPLGDPVASRLPGVVWTTNKSWAGLATAYGAVVEQQLAVADVSKLVADAKAGNPSRDELVARLDRDAQGLRYVGIEFGQSSIVPSKPADTIARGYGDCKDKATLLVAMLRTAGIPAEIALLRTGPGLDVDDDLPTLQSFDHAIVYVPGRQPMWIDPTSDFEAAGTLPAWDQGRRALLIASGTKDLVTTPFAPASANVYTATREVTMAEHGPGLFEETFGATGWVGADLRSGWADARPEAEAEFLDDRATGFGAKHGAQVSVADARDVGKPFTVRWKAEQAARAFTGGDDAVVYVDGNSLLGWVPQPLLDAQPPQDARKTDLVFFPYSGTVEYHVVPPAGFVVGPLPKTESVAVGGFSWSTAYEVRQDGSVVARFSLDTGPGRIAAADVEKVRSALTTALATTPMLAFDHAGARDLAAGKVAEGLKTYADLAAADPTNGYRLSQYAVALAQSGFGEVARARSKKARELAPDNAVVARQDGLVCMMSTDGRLLAGDFDRACAREALERAVALDPKVWQGWQSLASLLEHGDDGGVYTKGADVAAAIDVRSAHEKDSKDIELDALGEDLAHAQRWADLRAFVNRVPTDPTREGLRIVATTMIDGLDAARAEAASRQAVPDARRAAIEYAGHMLVQARRYPEAAALLEASAPGSANPVQLREQARLVGQLAPHETTKLDDGDPGQMMSRILAVMFAPSEKGWRDVLPLDVPDDGFQHIPDAYTLGDGKVSSDFALDIVFGGLQSKVEGSAATGWRVSWSYPSLPGGQSWVGFVVKEKGACRLRGTLQDAGDLGHEAYVRAHGGDVAGARTWLGWAWDALRAPTGDDPFSGSPFVRIWRGSTDADKPRAELAALALMAGSPSRAAEAAPLLEKAPRDDADTSIQIDRAIATSAEIRKDWPTMLAAGERLEKAVPGAYEPMRVTTVALARSGKADEAVKACEAWLSAHPNDADGRRLLSTLDIVAGDTQGARKPLLRNVDDGKASSLDYNNLAWLSVEAGDRPDDAIAWAKQAAELDGWKQEGSLNTLAAALAAAGRGQEAREVMTQALAANAHPGPEWTFVRGLLAEDWGLDDVAGDLYAGMASNDPGILADDARVMAQQRLAALQR